MGSINGVCKHSDLVVVKTTLLEEDLTWAFDAVLTEIKSNKQLSNPQPAVVVFAGNSDPDPDVYPWFSVRMTMENMFEEDAVVVVSSGNNAPVRRDVDTLPAMWADVTFPLIVAGSVNNAGVESVFSQGLNYVTVWAPGENVQCAARNDFRKATGTSFATGMVSFHTFRYTKWKASDPDTRSQG